MRGAIDRIAPVTHSEMRNDGTMQARTNSSISHGRSQEPKVARHLRNERHRFSLSQGAVHAEGRNPIPAVKNSSADARRRARRIAKPSKPLRALRSPRWPIRGPSPAASPQGRFDWATIFTPIFPPKNGSKHPETGLCAESTPISHHFSVGHPSGAAGFLIYLVFLWQNGGSRETTEKSTLICPIRNLNICIYISIGQ